MQKNHQGGMRGGWIGEQAIDTEKGYLKGFQRKGIKFNLYSYTAQPKG